MLILIFSCVIELLVFSNLYGQDDTITFIQPENDNYIFIRSELGSACGEMNYSDLMNKIDWFRSIKDSLNKYYWVQNFEREIVGSYIEESITMTQSIKTIAMSSKGEFEVFMNYYYLFEVIKDKNTDDIFYVKVVKKNDKISVKGIPISDEIAVVEEKYNFDELNKLKSEFNDKYNFELIIDDLFNYNVAYGFNCNVDRWVPNMRNEIDEAVKNNDQEVVLSFLRSAHLEKQLYGVDGVYQLLHENIDLEENVFQLFDSTRIRTGTALYCDGHLIRQKPVMGILYHIKNWYDTIDERK